MSLHKWCFSHSTNDFPDVRFDQSSEETLGVLWNSSSDTFCFKVSPSTNHIFTKRDFRPTWSPRTCNQQSQIFHAAINALKIGMAFLPVAAEWASFVQSLPVLEKLKIPRFVLSENLESIILYGFSDASEKGFGAVTYVSVIKNNRHSQLLCSKSRVAPLKTLTIPRNAHPHLAYSGTANRKATHSVPSTNRIARYPLSAHEKSPKALSSDDCVIPCLFPATPSNTTTLPIR
ncbi:uncharacterized protein TNIN_238131 [Trichonephila inaurata madagascariensis]|uniref:Uncharacterized protein n=1 Tax=Trichonephila inaurata madagascariensis TaxID=2747483 RepID=A0A8X7C0J6_9ARAC|nr:uncharacterized protein TNIN_238131 [Trichonephila inaurata madagascariensis]